MSLPTSTEILLRTQLAEMTRDRDRWKAAHDNQVELKRIISSRPDLGDRAPRVEKLFAELADARHKLALLGASSI